MEHGCVAKPPVLFEITNQEVKPMEIPSTKYLWMKYGYDDKENK